MPDITIVVCSRADARGSTGTLLHFMEWNWRVLPKAKFIIVEWGDPVGWRMPLHKTLKGEDLSVVYVPDSVTAKYEKDGVFAEYTAKNVGIRRAGPGLVLATNIDDFIPPELATAILAIEDGGGTVFRAERIDFDGEPRLSGMPKEAFGKIHGPTGAAGDFTMLWRQDWDALCGYWERSGQRAHLDSELIDRARRAKFPITQLPLLWHKNHPPGSWHGQKPCQPFGRPEGADASGWGLVDEDLLVVSG